VLWEEERLTSPLSKLVSRAKEEGCVNNERNHMFQTSSSTQSVEEKWKEFVNMDAKDIA
jgi:hypothetical protein